MEAKRGIYEARKNMAAGLRMNKKPQNRSMGTNDFVKLFTNSRQRDGDKTGFDPNNYSQSRFSSRLNSRTMSFGKLIDCKFHQNWNNSKYTYNQNNIVNIFLNKEEVKAPAKNCRKRTNSMKVDEALKQFIYSRIENLN